MAPMLKIRRFVKMGHSTERGESRKACMRPEDGVLSAGLGEKGARTLLSEVCIAGESLQEVFPFPTWPSSQVSK